jgi:tellurite resistance protein TehA-like permease
MVDLFIPSMIVFTILPAIAILWVIKKNRKVYYTTTIISIILSGLIVFAIPFITGEARKLGLGGLAILGHWFALAALWIILTIIYEIRQHKKEEVIQETEIENKKKPIALLVTNIITTSILLILYILNKTIQPQANIFFGWITILLAISSLVLSIVYFLKKKSELHLTTKITTIITVALIVISLALSVI